MQTNRSLNNRHFVIQRDERTYFMFDSYILKLVAESFIVGSIGITVIRFLLTRLVKQMDDQEYQRRQDHQQMLLWLASLSRGILTWEKQLTNHTMDAYGVNSEAGDTQEERDSAACRQFKQLTIDLDLQKTRLESAIRLIEQSPLTRKSYKRI